MKRIELQEQSYKLCNFINCHYVAKFYHAETKLYLCEEHSNILAKNLRGKLK